MSKSWSRVGGVAALIIVIIIALIVAVFVLHLNLTNIPGMSQPQLPVPAVSIANNWAGYVADSNLLNPQPAVMAVSGSWTVPSVTSTGSQSYSSIWIGIGGEFDQTLIQVGTEQDSVNGSATYYAWYEMLPNTAVLIPSFEVSPADQIQASIALSSLSSNTWSISIKDLTSGGNFQSTFTYASKQLSAEWIVERPELNGALTELANFGSATFTDCSATLSEKSGSITSFSHSAIVMGPEIVNNRSIQLVAVSSTSAGGSKFTVSYTATGL